MEVNRQAGADNSSTCIFFPYPGTDLYETCKAQGWVAGETNYTAERRVASLDLPTFPRTEIQRAYDWFEFRIYRGHKSLPVRLRKVLRTKIDAHPWIHQSFFRLLPLWHALRHRR